MFHIYKISFIRNENSRGYVILVYIIGSSFLESNFILIGFNVSSQQEYVNSTSLRCFEFYYHLRCWYAAMRPIQYTNGVTQGISSLLLNMFNTSMEFLTSPLCGGSLSLLLPFVYFLYFMHIGLLSTFISYGWKRDHDLSYE